MCGIVGIVSKDADVISRLVEALKRLEYRGYDSAGIAALHKGIIERRRAKGKLAALESLLASHPINLTNDNCLVGIGHTRWATHGIPSIENSHPHGNDRVVVVHNGIIENYLPLKNDLLEKGYVFESQTDTEVIAHLIHEALNNELNAFDAFKTLTDKLKGTYAIAAIIKDTPNTIYILRHGSPLVVGRGDAEMFIGSDGLAMAPWSHLLCYLEDGDYGVVTKDGLTLFNSSHEEVNRPFKQVIFSGDMIGKGPYRHFMLKEIHEQPETLMHTLASLIHFENQTLDLPINLDWQSVQKIVIVACGTSYYAGMVAKYWFESFAKLPVEVDIASEFRYRSPCLDNKNLYVFISQSGETIDTLAALTLVKNSHCPTLSIVNVQNSSIARQSDYVIYTQAGFEIGVASTKAFTAQLTVLACIALMASFSKKQVDLTHYKEHIEHLLKLPVSIQQTLTQDPIIQTIAQALQDSRFAIYLGRGSNYPIAMEGALKLKELSYIHASAYAAGELKHGPIALVDSHTPVIALIPYDQWFEKSLSNIQEVLARGGQVICLTDALGEAHLKPYKDQLTICSIPVSSSWLNPITFSIPLQLLAYHTALLKGTDVDQPRNLAKSVTVE